MPFSVHHTGGDIIVSCLMTGDIDLGHLNHPIPQCLLSFSTIKLLFISVSLINIFKEILLRDRNILLLPKPLILAFVSGSLACNDYYCSVLILIFISLLPSTCMNCAASVRKSYLFCLLIYLSNHLFTSVWTSGCIYLILWFMVQHYSYSFYCPNCSSFGHWDHFQVGPYALLDKSHTFSRTSLFSGTQVAPSSSVFSFSQPRSQQLLFFKINI